MKKPIDLEKLKAFSKTGDILRGDMDMRKLFPELISLLEQAKEIINFHANSLEMNQFDTTMEDNWLSNFTEQKVQE